MDTDAVELLLMLCKGCCCCAMAIDAEKWLLMLYNG
jgi:hypothetical protein